MIGGNQEAILQIKTTTKNAIGETVDEWENKMTLKGFLDLLGGSYSHATYNAKIQESTHLFIMDYISIPYDEVQSRLFIGDKPYEITLIDNPMGLNKHIEIYLKLAI